MMRPLVEFVQSQQLEWTPVHYGEVRDGVEGKLLSRDETTGASTMLLRFPAGWRASRHYLGTSEELFILDGALDVGADRMEAHSYAFLPAGFQYESMASARGAVALVFYEADAIAHSGVAPVGAMAADRLIRPYDTVTQPWSGLEIDPKIDHLAPKRKDLRIDPDGQYRSYLLGGLPHGMPPEQEGPLETHPHVEEMFCVSGDVAGTRGVMYPGAYFWRPPGIEHGANCSRQGFLLFFRVVGAVETTTSWSDTPHPIRLETPYAPYLPADLAALADRPYDGRPVY